MKSFKRVLSLVIILTLLTTLVTPICVHGAANGTEGKIKWELHDSGTLTLSSSTNNSVEMNDFTTSKLPAWYTYRNKIKSVMIKDNITRLGNYAFYNLNKLENISISGNVTDIGMAVFYKCSSMANILVREKKHYVHPRARKEFTRTRLPLRGCGRERRDENCERNKK